MNQLRQLLTTANDQWQAAEKIEALLDLLNSVEEIIPATPGSRAHVEHQLHRLMADMLATKHASLLNARAMLSTDTLLNRLYH